MHARTRASRLPRRKRTRPPPSVTPTTPWRRKSAMPWRVTRKSIAWATPGRSTGSREHRVPRQLRGTRTGQAACFAVLAHFLEHLDHGIAELNEGWPTVIERLRGVVARLRRPDPLGKYAGGEPPLRSALFNADQMEQHGRHLALAHRVAPGRTRDRLLTRLAENGDVLAEVCGLLAQALGSNRRITPAADWLLDNFYLI